MKKIIVTAGVILILLVMTITTIAEEKFKPQKFDVTFKIKYQDKTLDQIVVLEKMVKATNSDACSVKIEEIEEVSGYFLTSTGDTTISAASLNALATTDVYTDIILYTPPPRVEINENTKKITIRDSGGYQINRVD